MAGFDVDFMHGARCTVRRREFALLKAALYVNVLALLVSERHVSDLVVEHETVPVRVGLRLAVASREAVGLTQANVRHLRAGG